MARGLQSALALILLPFAALAGTATVSWSPTTERVDGTPVTITDYRVYYGTESPPNEHVQTVGTDYVFQGLDPAPWFFAVTAVDDAGLESALSTIVSKTIVSPPAPPAGMTVQEDARTAYVIVQTADRLTLVPVGTVPAGTPCQATHVRDANGIVAYLVAKSTVQWAGSVRPEVVVAQCAE